MGATKINIRFEYGFKVNLKSLFCKYKLLQSFFIKLPSDKQI